jgi:ribosomal protein S27E
MGIDIKLFVKTKKKFEEAELRHLNYRFMEATTLGYGNKPISLVDKENYYFTNDDNFYYEIDTFTRYYSKGYARGDWAEISMTINWLRYNFFPCEILYGGDSSDDIPILTEEEQEELNKYWYESGRLSYRQSEPQNELFAQKCPNCDEKMTQYMWSGGNGEINCLGCRYTLKTEDQGKTWQEKTKE